MANPQAENGHVDIAHEIVEALAKYRLSGQEWQCLLVVIRKTYGWKKVEDEISLSQFQRMTELSRPGVVRALSKLVSKQVLVSTHLGTTRAKKYKFNKNYEQWVTSTKRSTSTNFHLVPKRVPELVPKQLIPLVPKWVHTKETSTKETIKRNRTTFVKPTLEEVQKYCIERKNAVNPQKWFDHYQSNGWKVGKNPMKDWKAAVRTWEHGNSHGNGNGKGNVPKTFAQLKGEDFRRKYGDVIDKLEDRGKRGTDVSGRTPGPQPVGRRKELHMGTDVGGILELAPEETERV